MAFPDGWSHKWPIPINADSVISSPVSDWPCIVRDLYFPTDAWALMQATGADLRFSLDEAGTTELYYDTPRLDVAGEEAHLYVRVPSLASSADTTIYGWVGNDSATAPSAAWKQNTYSSDWAAFWPMEEGTGTTVGDRTANGIDGTIIGDGEEYWTQDAVTGSYSIVFPNNVGQIEHAQPMGNVSALSFVLRMRPGTLTDSWAARWDTYKRLLFRDEGEFYLRNAPDSSERGVFNRSLIVDAWSTVVGTADGAMMRLWIDGSQTEAPMSGPYIPPTSVSWYIAGDETPYRCNATFNFCAYKTTAMTDDEKQLIHLMLDASATWASAGALEALAARFPAARRRRTQRLGPKLLPTGVI